MKTFIKTLILSLVLFTSCSEKEEEIIISIKDFKVQTGEITESSAKINWSKAIASDNSAVTYSLYANNELITKDLTVTNYLLTELKSETKYDIKVVAANKNKISKSSTTTFTTLKEELGDFKLTIENISEKGAKVSWSVPTYKNSEESIEYDFYVNEEVFKSKLTDNSLVLDNLEDDKEYTIKVIAKVKTLTKTSTASFKTLEKVIENPVGLELSSKDFTCKSITIYWTKPTVSDGSKISYSVYVDYVDNDNLLKQIDDENITEIIIGEDNLSNSTDIIVKATTSNGGEIEKTFEINNIPDCPKPSEFTIEISDITDENAIVKWGSSTLTDDTEVTYEINILGGDYTVTTSLAKGLKTNEFKLENLKPETEYRVGVIAVSTEYETLFSSKQEVFTTAAKEIPVHPTIEVKSATLKSTTDSFSQQFFVRFKERVKDSNEISIKVNALNNRIGNFVYIAYDGSSFTGLYTNKLSDDDYSKMVNDTEKKGHLLITEGSNTYKVEFTYTIE